MAFNFNIPMMKNLVLDEPEVIMKAIYSNNFVKFLKSNSYAEKEIDLVIQFLVKTFKVEKNILKIWKIMYTFIQKFLINDVINAIQSIHFGHNDINLQRLIKNYIYIWKCMQEKCPPDECIPLVKEVIAKLQIILDAMPCMNETFGQIQDSLRLLQASVRRYETHCDGKPQEDFRLLSIFPQKTDFIEARVPRPNKIEGPYFDVEDYLDIHFRLIREDMVQTFREAINTCKQEIGFGKIVNNVSVSFPPLFKAEGVCHILSLDYHSPIDWSKTKKFLPGSLICLTEDFFKSSIIFGIIVKRSPISGQQHDCKLEVVFQTEECDVSVKQKYSLIETNAYFESYRHVLSALKRFNKNNFPLSDYIVKLDFTHNVPNHLLDKTFCLHEQCSSNKDCSSCVPFKVLNLDEWPSANDLKLDIYQQKAFQTAITQKLSLIQGPPGTGKTFLGIKIVKAILDNVDKKPIVICCVTNHALDQFLERLLKFTKKIVRMGDQSHLDVLLPHRMSNMKRAIRFEREGVLVDPILKAAFNIAVQIVPGIASAAPSYMLDDSFIALRDKSQTLNNLIESLQLCIQNCMDSAALNKILPQSFIDILCANDSKISTKLTENMEKWLNASTTVIYKKIQNSNFPNIDIEKIKFKDPRDIWGIHGGKRLNIFHQWRQNCIKQLMHTIEEAKKAYFHLLEHHERCPDFDSISLLQGADIIGVTMTGAAKFFSSLQYVKPEIFIVEEAAEALESHVISSLLPSTQQLILIGDHEQLRPLPATYEFAKDFNLNISLFERLIKNNCPSARLVTQFRMRPCIADLLVPNIYKSLESHQSVKEYANIQGTSHNLFFFNHNKSEDEAYSNKSISNKFEAEFIMNLIKYFVRYNYDHSQITVLAMYSEQVCLLQQLMEKNGMEKVLVTTVDNYQGEENDLIFISFVRSNESNIIGFLKESNRVCVALSRARKGLYCIGNFNMLALKSELFTNIKQKLNETDSIGESFPLCCPGHKRVISIKELTDFDSFLKNGCTGKCEFKLLCGHLCMNECHFDDMNHTLYKCRQACTKTVINSTGLPSHCARLCYQQCCGKKKRRKLKCGHTSVVDVNESPSTIQCFVHCAKLLACNHSIKVPCCKLDEKYSCTALVEVTLTCGHSHFVNCSTKNDLNVITCNEQLPFLSPCGHTVKIPCHESPDDKVLLAACKSNCGDILACGHECQGICSLCRDVKIHSGCGLKCKKHLMCGHKCTGMCGAPCVPCNSKCQLKCPHQSCNNPCVKPCVNCKEPCVRNCSHQKCLFPCYMSCSVQPCMQPCAEKLNCGHQCIGLCGDPCPQLCKICDHEYFKSQSTDNMYVFLIDCEHIIEVQELINHIENQILCSEWPSCPQCATLITYNKRFSDHLKEMKLLITKFDIMENLKEVDYLFHTIFGNESLVPWHFLETQRRIKYILEQQAPNETSVLILKSSLDAIQELFLLVKKIESSSMCTYFETLIMWINNHLHQVTFQQLDELESIIGSLKSCFE